MKINWGIGIGIVYVIFVTGMIFFAINVSKYNNDLVTDNYYDEAVNYQEKINAANNATKLESKLNVEYSMDLNAIQITSSGDEMKATGTLSFYKPDNASNDFKLNFITDDSGKALLPLENVGHGYWKVYIRWKSSGIDCIDEIKIFIP